MNKKTVYDGKVQLARETFERFKRHYPHHGDFTRVMRKLLMNHLKELEEGGRHV